MTCNDLGDLPAKQRKKICDKKFGRKGQAGVKTKCLETCGEVGRGECGFLKTYHDDGIDRVDPGIVVIDQYIQQYVLIL